MTYVDPQAILEALGPCTNDERDCEILRAAITLDGAPKNERVVSIRKALATQACSGCIKTYGLLTISEQM